MPKIFFGGRGGDYKHFFRLSTYHYCRPKPKNRYLCKNMEFDDTFTVTVADGGKKRFLPLLLIGDESEVMIDRYLDSGTLFVGTLDGEPIAVCVAVDLDPGTVEIKNLAVVAEYRRHGVGRRMLQHVESLHRGKKIILGTGETPSTLRFYSSCGYSYSHRIPNFFTDNYPTPIIEEGVTLRDMIYLENNNG